MANIIKAKRSAVPGKIPATTDLALGEIGINTYDGKAYIKKDVGGVESIVALGGAGSGDVTGPAVATDNALTRFDLASGKVIQNSSVTLDDNGNLANINAVGFDTTPGTLPTAVGSMFWDSGNGTPSIILDADVTLQLGQEQLALVYNGTGATIQNGKVVAVMGAQGQRPSVALADADSEALSASTLGIATEDIENGAEGFVTTFGFVRGLDTSAFTAGAPVYLSQTAGSFTATRPSAPAHTVALGWVIKVNASSGEIFVNINNGWELGELHDVLISAVANNEALIYNSATGVWKNTALKTVNGTTVVGAGNIDVGDLDGPASATDNAITRFDGTTGKLVQNSSATIDDSGNLTSLTQNATGTGANKMPTGTTAQRPASPTIGMVRYNTTIDALENYTSQGWLKVNVKIPFITSIDGTIWNTAASQLTINGSSFGSGTATVRFSAGATTADVSVVPTTDFLATVTVPASIYALAAGTTVSIFLTNSDGGISNTVTKTVVGLPTGGTITTTGGYRIHTFTSSSSFVVPTGFAQTLEYLVVGGGGGGGCCYGGGGGGGGFRSATIAPSVGSTTVTVGAGGAGASGSNNGGVGTDSAFGAITSTRGGFGGGVCGNNGGSGGSGGGGSSGGVGGSGTSGQGFNGGNGAGSAAGGGGGGAAQAGGNGTESNGGKGGDGALITWRGSSEYFGAGAGGQGNTGGAAGLGGVPGYNGSPATPPAAPANSGAGGSGNLSTGSTNGGAGGSGIVMIRYTL